MANINYSTSHWISNASSLRASLQLQNSESLLVEDYINLDNKAPFIQGLKQFYYWRRQLAPSVSQNTIVIAFLGKEGLAPINVLEVCKSLKQICNMDNVSEVFQGAHTRLLGISFTNSREVRKISENFHFFKDTIVSFVFSSTPEYTNFRLLWLPPLFQAEKVTHLLNKYFAEHTIVRLRTQIDDNKYANTNVITGTVKFKEGLPIEKIPHLFRLPLPHKGSALLMLEGREAMCLRCRVVGHLRKKCPAKKCSTCKNFHPPDESCPDRLYSNKTAGRFISSEQDIWLEQAEDLQEICLAQSVDVNVKHVTSPDGLADNFSTSTPTYKSYSKLYTPSVKIQKDPFLFDDPLPSPVPLLPSSHLVDDLSVCSPLDETSCLNAVSSVMLIENTEALNIDNTFLPLYAEKALASPLPADDEKYFDPEDILSDTSSELEPYSTTSQSRKRRRSSVGGRTKKNIAPSDLAGSCEVGFSISDSSLLPDSAIELHSKEIPSIEGHDPPDIL